MDLFLILPLSFAMGLAKPSSQLASIRPPPTLFRASVLVSILGHIVCMVSVMALVAWWSSQQPFFSPQVPALVNGEMCLLNGGFLTLASQELRLF